MSKPLPPPPSRPSRPALPAPQTPAPLTPEADPVVVDKLVEDVKRMLRRFTEASKEPAASLEINTPSDPSKGVLEIPGVSKGISYLCVLQALSGSPNMVFRIDPKSCTPALQAEIRAAISSAADSARMDPSDAGFTASTKLFSGLYRAVISFAKIIATPGTYQASPGINTSLSHNLQELIRQVIAYLRRYMEVYNVTDNKMISKSYDLLYLMTVMGLMKADSTGHTLNDLDTLHQQVKRLIVVNTESYKQLLVPAPSAEEAQINPEIDDLYGRLAKLYQNLEKQSKMMAEEIGKINNSQDKIRQGISKDLMRIGSSIGKNANALSQGSARPGLPAPNRPALPPPVRGGAEIQDNLIQNLRDLNQLVEGITEDMSSKTRIYTALNETISQYN